MRATFPWCKNTQTIRTSYQKETSLEQSPCPYTSCASFFCSLSHLSLKSLLQIMDVFVSVQNRASDTPRTKVEWNRQKTNGFNMKRQKEDEGETAQPWRKNKGDITWKKINTHMHTNWAFVFYKPYKLFVLSPLFLHFLLSSNKHYLVWFIRCSYGD